MIYVYTTANLENFFQENWKQNFGTKKKKFFKKKVFGTYILAEVLKNEFLWQSDHGLCHQTTVYRSQKFGKNQENTYVLGHTPMGAIIYKARR